MGKNGNIWKQYGKQLRKYGKRLDNCDLMKGKHVVFVCYCKSMLVRKIVISWGKMVVQWGCNGDVMGISLTNKIQQLPKETERLKQPGKYAN